MPRARAEYRYRSPLDEIHQDRRLEFQCTLCDQRYEEARQLARHRRDRHGPTISCEWCSQTFPVSRRENMRRHVRISHPEHVSQPTSQTGVPIAELPTPSATAALFSGPLPRTQPGTRGSAESEERLDTGPLPRTQPGQCWTPGLPRTEPEGDLEMPITSEQPDERESVSWPLSPDLAEPSLPGFLESFFQSPEGCGSVSGPPSLAPTGLDEWKTPARMSLEELLRTPSPLRSSPLKYPSLPAIILPSDGHSSAELCGSSQSGLLPRSGVEESVSGTLHRTQPVEEVVDMVPMGQPEESVTGTLHRTQPGDVRGQFGPIGQLGGSVTGRFHRTQPGQGGISGPLSPTQTGMRDDRFRVVEEPVGQAVGVTEIPLFPPPLLSVNRRQPVDPRLLFNDAPSNFYRSSLAQLAGRMRKEAIREQKEEVEFFVEGCSVVRKERARLNDGREYEMTTYVTPVSGVKLRKSQGSNTDVTSGRCVECGEKESGCGRMFHCK